jgi:transcriptional regulator with XRE-family HTH domain
MTTACEYLNFIFEAKRKKNSKYSLRAFARDCGLNSGRMSQFLSGQRLLTPAMIKKISQNLGLSETELLLFSNLRKKEKSVYKVEGEVLKNIYHPINFYVLSLFETEKFQATAEFIAKRLKISSELAQQSLDFLEKNNLIARNSENKLVPRYDIIQTTTNIPNESLRQSHKISLSRIIENLDHVDVKDRHMTSVTLCVDPVLLPMAQKKIMNFVRKIATGLESGRKKEVYELNIQLFPVTQPASLTKELV